MFTHNLPVITASFVFQGLVQPNMGMLDLTLESPETERMRLRCNNFVSGLENAMYDPEAPIVQGLCPIRRNNVRLE
jgi:hypothetical protein